MIKNYNYIKSNATFISVKSGNWNDYTTWNIIGVNGKTYQSSYYPQAGNTVTIKSGHSITLTQNESVLSLSILGVLISGSFNVSINIDTDVLSYQTKLVAIGGTLTGSYLNALDYLVKQFKNANVWNAILSMNPIMGGTINSALVPIKYTGSYSPYLNNGSSTLTNSAYSDAKGITSIANSKIDTLFNPSANTLTNNNITAIIGITNDENTTNGLSFGDNNVSGGAGIYFTKNAIGLNGGGQQNLFPQGGKVPYVLTLSSNGTVNQRKDWKDLLIPTTVTSVALNTNFSLFSARSFGATTSTIVSIGFYLAGSYLTPTQTDFITTQINIFFTSIGRATTIKDCIVYGDSITYGTGASVFTNRYGYLLANALGLKEANLGIGGSLYRADGSGIPGGYPNRADLLNYNILSGGKVYLLYGTNDMRNDIGSGTNYVDFQTKLTIQVNELLAYGMLPSNIIIGSIPYNTEAGNSSTLKANYVQAAFNVAHNTGVYYADVYNYMATNGGASLMSGDNVHPNDAGHLAIKTALLAATSV